MQGIRNTKGAERRGPESRPDGTETCRSRDVAIRPRTVKVPQTNGALARGCGTRSERGRGGGAGKMDGRPRERAAKGEGGHGGGRPRERADPLITLRKKLALNPFTHPSYATLWAGRDLPRSHGGSVPATPGSMHEALTHSQSDARSWKLPSWLPASHTSTPEQLLNPLGCRHLVTCRVTRSVWAAHAEAPPSASGPAKTNRARGSRRCRA